MLGLGNNIFKSSTAEGSLVSNRVSFIGLLNETYGADAEAAYSVRKLSSSATVAMTIRRESDDEELAIGFVNGNIDEAAIEAHCTGTTCKVAQWNDQSGNDNHATQDSEGSQPTIYTGGALVKENGLPALNVPASGHLTLDTQITAAGSLIWLGKPQVFQYNRIIDNAVELKVNIEGYVNTISGTNPWNPSSISINGTVETSSPYGSNLIGVYHSAFAIGSSTSNPISEIGYSGQSNRSWLGTLQEVIFYSTQRTSYRTDIEENIGDYFTQNTPLLDTYSGAAAAYSLRKLKSDYTGPAISVRNASNVDLDIGFNVFGELDTVSLLAHTGSGDGFVGQWYDQSGSGNHAIQDNEGSQPQIVSSGAVITENGKPTVEFDGTNDTLLTGVDFLLRGTFSVAKATGTGSVFGSDGGAEFFRSLNSTQYHFRNNDSIKFPTDTTVQSLLYAANDTTSELAVNGAPAITSATLQTDGFDDFRIGNKTATSTEFLNGNLQEVVIYETNKSSVRTGIETNINTFYNIYS